MKQIIKSIKLASTLLLMEIIKKVIERQFAITESR